MIQVRKFKKNAVPGDIVDDRGCIMVSPPFGTEQDYDYALEFGIVYVTKSQATDAVAWGWRVVETDVKNTDLVVVSRDAGYLSL